MPWISTPLWESWSDRSTRWISRRRPTNSARVATGTRCRALSRNSLAPFAADRRFGLPCPHSGPPPFGPM
jgi:hypothetical protein